MMSHKTLGFSDGSLVGGRRLHSNNGLMYFGHDRMMLMEMGRSVSMLKKMMMRVMMVAPDGAPFLG